MNFITVSGIKRCTKRLMLTLTAVCALLCIQAATAQAAILMSLVKSNDAPNPVQSGYPFTYTITYSYSGAIGFTPGTPGTLVISDVVPAELEVLSATTGSSIVGTGPTTVTFNVGGLTLPAGGGTVQINVRFRPGVTCNGTRACNIASMWEKSDPKNIVRSNEDCVTASASVKWQFFKDYLSGCVIDNDEIVYRVWIYNPPGNDIGGINLTNISITDQLPAGASLTGVGVAPLNGGAVTGEWNAPATGTGTITLTNTPGPALTNLTVQPGWGWYGAYIHVKYPSPTFTPGQVVTNNATLRYQTPCSGGQTLTMTASASNTLCDQPQIGGWMSKWLNLWLYFPANPYYTPTWSPGCCGTYSVYYTNSGAVSQSSVVINDPLPSSVDVGNITTNVMPGITSVTMDAYCYVAGSCSSVPAVSIPYTTSGTYSPSGLPGPICRIKWTYTGSVNPGSYLYNTVDVCVRSIDYATGTAVVAGQNIVNTACVSGTNVPTGLCGTSTQPVTPTAPNILAGKYFVGKSGSCMPGCSPNTTGPFYPGDLVRFRMIVSNVGSATATPCTITDVLPAGFTYAGSPTYYYGGPLYWSGATNPTCCTLTSTPPTVLGGVTAPTVGSTTCTWSFPTLPSNCSGAVDYLVIEFDVKADNSPTIPPGTYSNTFTFGAGNLATPVTSNPAYVIINGTAQVQVAKEVRPNITGSPFGSSANVQATNLAEYRLRIQNTGMLTLANINLLDIMPWVGDIRVFPPYLTRGSTFNMPLMSPITAVPGYSYSYNTLAAINAQNPKRSALFPGMGDPFGAVAGTWAGAVPVGGTYSFRIVGSSPATLIAPGATQDFYFTAPVPAGTKAGLNACNSFGLEVTPYGMPSTPIRTESSPACVTAIDPPPDKCLGLWGDTHREECCGFTTTINGNLGAIAGLGYNVLNGSGVVQSVQTAPCLPSSTVPTSLAGTTSGMLNFSPACAGPLIASFHANSTTVSGDVCIELIAFIIGKNGTKIICRDTVCIHCDPAPKQRCDSMFVTAALSKKFSLRTFTIYNLKAPMAPICSVKIQVIPPPGGGGLYGAGLIIDGIGHAWPAGSSNTYTQITTTHGLPGNTYVQFTLGVEYGMGWSGNVIVTVYHCDKDSCTMRYGPWDAGKGGLIDIGSQTDVPDKATLHMNALTFSRERAAGRRVRSIAVHFSDDVSEIVAATAATYPCEVDEEGGEPTDCNDLIEGVHVKDNSMMIDLRRDLDDRQNANDPIITIVYRILKDGGNPSVEIVYYDENGQEVGNDAFDLKGEDPPGLNISSVTGGDRVAAVMSALTAHPNPTSGGFDVGFTLPTASTVDLDLLDMNGNKVATVITGERIVPGEHHRNVDLSKVPSGSYLVSLRVNGVPSVLRVELTK